GDIVPWYHAKIGNCIIRRDALPHASAPFSTAFDLTGGEDMDLFHRINDNGGYVVAAAQAHNLTYCPASRANLFWAVRRALRNGGTSVEILWWPCNWRQRMRISWNGGLKGTKSAIRAGQLWGRDKTAAVHHLLLACHDFGAALRVLGVRIKEYRYPFIE